MDENVIIRNEDVLKKVELLEEKKASLYDSIKNTFVDNRDVDEIIKAAEYIKRCNDQILWIKSIITFGKV